MRPRGTWRARAARASSRLVSENIFATVVAMRGVSIRPGTTVLARMPWGAYCCATIRVNCVTAALVTL